MNKTEVCKRAGWTAGRVEKFLIVEHQHHRNGIYGSYIEYEYSLAQILAAEALLTWRAAAAKYLRLNATELTVERLHLLNAEIEQQTKEESEREAASRAASIAEREAQLITFRGGLTRLGMYQPDSDGWYKFTVEEINPYIDVLDYRGPITPEYITQFYTLWNAGAGYCNRLGVVRKLIAPVKMRLIRIVLHCARKHGWVFGAVNDVLYVDTPDGQVSWHLQKGTDISVYPRYPGEWSGIKNSGEILTSLWSPKKATRNKTATAS